MEIKEITKDEEYAFDGWTIEDLRKHYEAISGNSSSDMTEAELKEEIRQIENGNIDYFPQPLTAPMFSKGTGRTFQMPALADVQEVFKGQEVTQAADGKFLIETRGGKTLIIQSVNEIEPNRIALNIGYSKEKISESK